MTHFALLCQPYAGHLNPMTALARGLVERGHHATLVAQIDVGATGLCAGLGFEPVGAVSHPPGTLVAMEGRLARTTGLFGIGGAIRDVARTTAMFCREGGSVLARIGAEAIIADQTEAAGGLLARRLRLPQVSVAAALLVNREPLMPPPFIGWHYDATPWGAKRNRGGYRVADLMMRPVRSVIEKVSRDWALGPLVSIEDCLSPMLQLSQTIEGFDFPRCMAPSTLVHVGPLREAEAASFRRPDARPLVFCSLGSLQGSRFGMFEVVARACAARDLSLVIAHGGRLTPQQIGALPGRPLVDAYWPQRAVIAQAAAVVTHGGLNTVLDALAAGVPQIVTPIAFEQGAIAARVEHSGSGLALQRRGATSIAIGRMLDRILSEPAFSLAAGRLQAECAGAGGVGRAVDLIEAAMGAAV